MPLSLVDKIQDNEIGTPLMLNQTELKNVLQNYNFEKPFFFEIFKYQEDKKLKSVLHTWIINRRVFHTI